MHSTSVCTTPFVSFKTHVLAQGGQVHGQLRDVGSCSSRIHGGLEAGTHNVESTLDDTFVEDQMNRYCCYVVAVINDSFFSMGYCIICVAIVYDLYLCGICALAFGLTPANPLHTPKAR